MVSTSASLRSASTHTEEAHDLRQGESPKCSSFQLDEVVLCRVEIHRCHLFCPGSKQGKRGAAARSHRDHTRVGERAQAFDLEERILPDLREEKTLIARASQRKASNQLGTSLTLGPQRVRSIEQSLPSHAALLQPYSTDMAVYTASSASA